MAPLAASRPLSAAFFALVSLGALQQAAAYPTFWAGETPDCLGHPQRGRGGHGAPMGTNSAISFVLRTSDGAATTTVCPSPAGASYTLTESLPQAGHAFVTVSAGSITPGNKPFGCPGANFAAGNAAMSFSHTLSLKCSDVTAKGSLTVQLTFATGWSAQFNTNSASFSVDEACYERACSPPKPSPSPKPSPPPRPNCPRQPAAVAGVRWPSTCAGRPTCRGSCRAGFNGGPVVAQCRVANTWRVTSGRCVRSQPTNTTAVASSELSEGASMAVSSDAATSNDKRR